MTRTPRRWRAVLLVASALLGSGATPAWAQPPQQKRQLPTVEQMKSSGATALAVDAGRTLLFDKTKLIELADASGIAIQAFPPVAVAEPQGAARGINQE